MKKFLFYGFISAVLAFLFLCFYGCGTIQLNERKEGLVDGKFRVYVKLDTLDIPEEMSDKQLDMLLVEGAKIRYDRLWKAMAVSKGEKITPEANVLIINSLKTAGIHFRKEREDYAEALIDFSMDSELAKLYFTFFPELLINDEK